MIRASRDGHTVALMCVAEILCMAGFATYPALLPTLRGAWGLSNTEAGLIGGILFLGYVASVPLLTALTDRHDARRVYLASCIVAASGSALFARSRTDFGAGLARPGGVRDRLRRRLHAGSQGHVRPDRRGICSREQWRFTPRCRGSDLPAPIFLPASLPRAPCWRWALRSRLWDPSFAALLVAS